MRGGDEEKGLIDGSCFPGYDNDENSKRSCDPLRDNVTVLPGRSCVVDGAENIFEAKDPFPFKPSNTSCGWSRQPQLPELGKDENEKGQPALPTSPLGVAGVEVIRGGVVLGVEPVVETGFAGRALGTVGAAVEVPL